MEGRIAEQVGHNCLLCCCASWCMPCITGWVLRTATRNENDIDGNALFDILISCFLPCCAIQQEAREVQANMPGLPEVDRN